MGALDALIGSQRLRYLNLGDPPRPEEGSVELTTGARHQTQLRVGTDCNMGETLLLPIFEHSDRDTGFVKATTPRLDERRHCRNQVECATLDLNSKSYRRSKL